MPHIRILAQAVLKISCSQSFSIAIMVESKKRHNLVNISRNSLKSLSGHLSIDRKPYAKYENPCSSGSCLGLGLSWFNWYVSFAPEVQCCYSLSPHVCFILVLILISMFLR